MTFGYASELFTNHPAPHYNWNHQNLKISKFQISLKRFYVLRRRFWKGDLCLSVCLSVYLSINLSICLSVWPSVRSLSVFTVYVCFLQGCCLQPTVSHCTTVSSFLSSQVETIEDTTFAWVWQFRSFSWLTKASHLQSRVVSVILFSYFI